MVNARSNSPYGPESGLLFHSNASGFRCMDLLQLLVNGLAGSALSAFSFTPEKCELRRISTPNLIGIAHSIRLRQQALFRQLHESDTSCRESSLDFLENFLSGNQFGPSAIEFPAPALDLFRPCLVDIVPRRQIDFAKGPLYRKPADLAEYSGPLHMIARSTPSFFIPPSQPVLEWWLCAMRFVARARATHRIGVYSKHR
uniref:Uncharacterized protein n=1 Tax=Candidatus Kentrum sp. UNK TaxID=2126344 RepID=A0A451B640_9GAMM|nr:MAG: hypothetical protein BECKUNK1418G_GA0071005_12822 [Candidatus Kentron sp. UNK]VFK73748.1 MAG: hypothetical protein BECKUNK1418H_GA0071006_12732 [Candidatus Kentron sp. UNK]